MAAIPGYLEAANMYQSPNAGVLEGFMQGVQGTSGILNTLNQKKQLQFEQQNAEERQKQEEASQQALNDYRNSTLNLKQQDVDINREKLSKMGMLTPYQQAQLDLMRQRIELEKSKGSTTSEAQKARADYYNKMTESTNYRSLPIDQKSALLAQASGMGYDPNEATSLFMQGKNIRDLAKDAGFDPENMPDAIYPATKKDIAAINQRKTALQEINTLNPIISSALAPYSRTVMGYSPQQITDAISNTDPDAQAKFLAAKAIIPELSAIRLRAMQGSQIGIEAIREVTNASMSNVKAFKGLVSPEVYDQMNKYIDSWITQATNSANRVNASQFSQQEQVKGGNTSASQIKTQNTNVPSLSDFLKEAKKANPNATDKQLSDFYYKEYPEAK